MNKITEEYRKKINYIARNIYRVDWKWFKYDMIVLMNKIQYTEDNWGWYAGFLAINMEGNVLTRFDSGAGLKAPEWNDEWNIPKHKSRSRKVHKETLDFIFDFMNIDEVGQKIDKIYNELKISENFKGLSYIPC